MASDVVDQYFDGVFVDQKTPLDEVDASKVIEIIRDSEIPPKYFHKEIFSGHASLSCGDRFERTSEQSLKYRLIHGTWGKRLPTSNVVDCYGPFGLITVKTSISSEECARDLAENIIKLLPAQTCQVLRWNDRHLLLCFKSWKYYEMLGQLFLQGRLENIVGMKVREIEPTLLCSLPHCFVEIEAGYCDRLFQSLVPAILPFSSCFPFARLRESDDGDKNHTMSSSTSAEEMLDQSKGNQLPVPVLGITLQFQGSNQLLAARSLQSLPEVGWQPLVLPGAVARVLDDGLHYFIHESLSLPLLAVKTGCPQAGVQLVVFVQEEGNFRVMEQFYSKLFGVKPIEQGTPGGTICTSIMPLSPQMEFVLAFYRGLKTQSMKKAALYVHVKDVYTIRGIIKICTDYWHINDPEGNRIVIFQSLK